jgi:hypothetical protein
MGQASSRGGGPAGRLDLPNPLARHVELLPDLLPREAADQLVGRRFASFKEFREAFWMAVAAVPHLAAQFSGINQERMRRGVAPFSPRSTWVGGRGRLELHHTPPLSRGGTVYDLSKLSIVTPRQHDAQTRGTRK